MKTSKSCREEGTHVKIWGDRAEGEMELAVMNVQWYQPIPHTDRSKSPQSHKEGIPDFTTSSPMLCSRVNTLWQCTLATSFCVRTVFFLQPSPLSSLSLSLSPLLHVWMDFPCLCYSLLVWAIEGKENHLRQNFFYAILYENSGPWEGKREESGFTTVAHQGIPFNCKRSILL